MSHDTCATEIEMSRVSEMSHDNESCRACDRVMSRHDSIYLQVERPHLRDMTPSHLHV